MITWGNTTHHTPIQHPSGQQPLEQQPSEQPKSFYPSKTFQGAQVGYVFTTGEYGTGYYLDQTNKV